MIPADATLLRFYINAAERLQGTTRYRAVVERARDMRIAGASVFTVDMSYGAHRHIHDAKNEYSAFEIPVEIDIVDAPDKIEDFIAVARELIGHGLILRRPVRVVRYASSERCGGWVGKGHGASPDESEHQESSDDVMRIDGPARRVTLYVGSSDTWNGRNLASAIVMRCREMGIAGATASLGVMGFGQTSRIHRAHFLGLSEDLPERIEIIDQPQRIDQLLPVLDEMVSGGLIVVDDVQVVHYRHDPKPR